jgi:hypothetical protein
VLCFAAALCLSERRRKLSAGLEEKMEGGELEKKKGTGGPNRINTTESRRPSKEVDGDIHRGNV